MEHIEELLARAGFDTLREARHPYGLNQRQAGGKFTVAEADLLIERLEAAELVQQGDGEADVALAEPAAAGAGSAPSAAPRRTPRASPRPAGGASTASPRPQRKAQVLSAFDDDVLVAELERRGWCCIPPVSIEE